MISLIVLIVSAFGNQFAKTQYASELQQLKDEQALLTESQALILSQILSENQNIDERVFLVLSGALANPSIVGAQLTSMDGDNIHSLGKLGTEDPSLFAWGEKILIAVNDTVLPMGMLYTYSSDALIRQNTIEASMRTLKLVTILTILMATVLVLWLRLVFERPLNRLVQALDREPGSEHIPVNWNSDDEMGFLISKFNILNSKVHETVNGLKSELRETEKREVKRIKAFANATMEGLIVHEHHIIVDVNDAFCRLMGMQQEDLIGMNLHSFIDLDYMKDEMGSCVADAIMRKAKLIDAKGKEFIVELLERTFTLDANNRKIISVRDVTEQFHAEEKIRYLAHNDPLTSLKNRVQFRAELRQYLSPTSRVNENVSLLFLDLDRFKNVNDEYGHEIGDQLLKQAAKRMKDCLGKRDIAARLGGDEFAIVLVSEKNGADPLDTAHTLIDEISKPYAINSMVLEIGVSVGLVQLSDTEHTIEEILKRADLSLYKAKNSGRGTVCVYDKKMAETLLKNQQIERKLREAIKYNEIEIHFQPQLNLNGRGIDCFEALARWHDPELGHVPPDIFIPIAERSGLVSSFGSYVQEAAIRIASSWPKDIKLAVNVSPTEFGNPNLARQIAALLKKYDFEAHRLELEITEASLFSDEARALKTMKSLKSKGISIAIDDFGTGYSSLSFLQRFPVDRIKIDKSFVGKIIEDRDSAKIVSSIIGLSKNLGIDVVAEGIETTQQRQALEMQGCTSIQGYLVGKPLSVADVTLFISDAPEEEKTEAA